MNINEILAKCDHTQLGQLPPGLISRLCYYRC